MNTIEELRDKAKEMELSSVSFLTETGTFAKTKKQMDHAEFVFIDGTTMIVSKKDVSTEEFGNLEFKLMPNKPDA